MRATPLRIVVWALAGANVLWFLADWYSWANFASSSDHLKDRFGIDLITEFDLGNRFWWSYLAETLVFYGVFVALVFSLLPDNETTPSHIGPSAVSPPTRPVPPGITD